MPEPFHRIFRSSGILFGSWYTQPIIDRVLGKNRCADLDRELQRIVFFERMLLEDGAVIIKLWLHLPKDEAKRKRRKDSIFGRFAKMYDRFAAVSERAIRMTDTAEAPWRKDHQGEEIRARSRRVS